MRFVSGFRKSVVFVNTQNNCRLFASSSGATDSIQKLFVDKIAEYKSKAKSSRDGLVDVDANVTKALHEEMERIKRTFGVKDGEEAKLMAKFNDEEFKVDPINMSEWK